MFKNHLSRYQHHNGTQRLIELVVFQCLFCGRDCCSFKREEDMPLVFPWEKRLLEKKAGERGLSLVFKPYITYRISEGYYAVLMYRWIINGTCPFLDEKGLCSIHKEKPLACRMYPLLLGWDDGTLRVSGACPWIRDNLDKIRGADPSRVFPEEFKAVVEAAAILDNASKLAGRNGWERVVGGDYSGARLVDIDLLF